VRGLELLFDRILYRILCWYHVSCRHHNTSMNRIFFSLKTLGNFVAENSVVMSYCAEFERAVVMVCMQVCG